MEHYITLIKDWVIGLGEKHGVNPLLLGCLYLVSKVGFVSFLAWMLSNIKAKKPILTPILCAAVSFSLPYSYLIIAGRNISPWVYVFIGFVFVYGAFVIWKKVTAKPGEPEV